MTESVVALETPLLLSNNLTHTPMTSFIFSLRNRIKQWNIGSNLAKIKSQNFLIKGRYASLSCVDVKYCFLYFYFGHILIANHIRHT